MSQFTITILFALCISPYTNAEVDSSILTDLKESKGYIESAVKVLTAYAENFLLTLPKNQENEFNKAIDDEISATKAELHDAARKNGNSEKARQCAKVGLDKLKVVKDTSFESNEKCLVSQEEIEVEHYFDTLIDEISAAKKLQSSIENLEKDAEDSNDKDIKEKISSVKVSVNLLKNTVSDLLNNGNRILENVKNTSLACSKKQVDYVHSETVSIKQNAIECNKQA